MTGRLEGVRIAVTLLLLTLDITRIAAAADEHLDGSVLATPEWIVQNVLGNVARDRYTLYDGDQCPPRAERFGHSAPDCRNHSAMSDFRHGRGFLFFQHLRKAGGTSFCATAVENTPSGFYRPPCKGFSCGPHCYLPGERGGRIEQHNVSSLLHNMLHVHSAPARIVAPEWEGFKQRWFELRNVHDGVVFATLMRHPLWRIISLYAYEHLEDRDRHRSRHNGTVLSFPAWRNSRYFATENYVRIFGDCVQQRRLDEKNFRRALHTLRRFDLIGILERQADTREMLAEQLGWSELHAVHVNPSGLTSQQNATLAQLNMTRDEWRRFVDENRFDLRLYAWANRLLDERLRCGLAEAAHDDVVEADAFDETCLSEERFEEYVEELERWESGERAIANVEIRRQEEAVHDEPDDADPLMVQTAPKRVLSNESDVYYVLLSLLLVCVAATVVYRASARALRSSKPESSKV